MHTLLPAFCPQGVTKLFLHASSFVPIQKLQQERHSTAALHTRHDGQLLLLPPRLNKTATALDRIDSIRISCCCS